MIAERLNNSPLSSKTSFIALPHTEGCGASSGESEEIFRRTIVGHVLNPVVKNCLLLEHGCEKTHNDYFAEYIKSVGISPSKFGWASVQMDGGIDKVTEKVENWFNNLWKDVQEEKKVEAGLEHLRVGILTPFNLKVSSEAAKCLAHVTQAIIYCGGTVIVPQNTGIAQSHVYLGEVIDETCPSVSPSIAYGQRPVSNGFHMMETITDHWVENITGLTAGGVEIMIYLTEGDHARAVQSHPMIPLIQVATPDSNPNAVADVDLKLGQDSSLWHHEILELVTKVASRQYRPKLWMNNDFQISRGALGISM